MVRDIAKYCRIVSNNDSMIDSVTPMIALDFKTMVFMVIMLTLMLSALLAFARLHTEGIRGLGYWTLGNLAISLGMAVIVSQFDQTPWHMIPATTLIALGNGLYINGIQAFKERKPDYRIPLGLSLLVAVGDSCLLLVQQDIRLTVILNALIYLVANFICAKMLLIRIQPPLRTAYWFTGFMFLMMALLMAIRAFGAFMAAPAVFDAMSQWPINKLTFLLGSISQLCTTFGFVLMLNYRMAEKLRRMAAHDWLTGALNRRNLEDAAERMEANCKRYDLGMAMLMIDLDHFKQVNDQYGHQFGDEVLRQFADTVRDQIRAGDLFGRYGGEEFCILLANTAEKEAMALGERIRLAFANRQITHKNKQTRCTVSIGCSESSDVGHGFQQLFAAADAALYTAKKQGRNRVVAHSGLPSVWAETAETIR